jgi:hypothetical protein
MLKPIPILACILLAAAALPAQKTAATIAPGSKIYIEPMGGFETYLAAALQKKQVPVVVVADKNAADFDMAGTSGHQNAGWAKTIFMGDIHSNDEASITVTNVKTSEVAFAYAVDKKSTLHGQQTVAEACAKHLKHLIDETH